MPLLGVGATSLKRPMTNWKLLRSDKDHRRFENEIELIFYVKIYDRCRKTISASFRANRKKVLQKGKKVAGKDFFSTGIGTKKVELPTYRADGSEKM